MSIIIEYQLVEPIIRLKNVPNFKRILNTLPVRAKALLIAGNFKAFALTGRQVCSRNYPGRCPGLRASAPSGRVGKNNKELFHGVKGVKGVKTNALLFEI